MTMLTLDYPVYSLDRHLLLPAGTILSEENLHALISSGGTDFQRISASRTCCWSADIAES